MQPREKDLKQPEVEKYIEKYLKGVASILTEDRMCVTKLIENIVLGVLGLEKALLLKTASSHHSRPCSREGKSGR